MEAAAHPNRNSLIHLVQSEPQRTKLLLEVAGGGVLAVAIWSWLGSTLVGAPLFLAVTLLLVTAYAAALVLLTVSLVRDADHWQVESAMQARRLLSTGSRRSSDGPAADPTPATFDHWYFVLRLEDEIKRARRYGSQVAVVLMKIGAPGQEPTPAITEQINFDVATMAANHSQTMTMPSAIGPLEYAFLLPDTDRNEARARVAPLLNPLGDYWCQFGIAVYPDDGTEAEILVVIAREQVDSQKQAVDPTAPVR